MSNEAERLHRQDPARDQPIRDFSHYARNHGLGARATGGEDPISHGVKLGYSVLDEQMREGQRLAERLRGRAPSGGAALDVGALIERALNIYRDIGALAFAATEALARNPTLGMGRPPAAPADAAAPAHGAPFALEIRSSRRVGVKLDMRPEMRARSPQVGPLHALGAAAPITAVGFEADPESREPRLRLEIGDDQPPGVYNAVVVDAASGEPCGTLTVRIPG
jgi:hypothetical protein